jgi:phosphate-selective porin
MLLTSAAGIAAFLRVGIAEAQNAPPPETAAGAAPARVPGSPESPAGYNVPLAQPTDESAVDHARIDNSPSAHDGHPLAGYHNGLFFLRDHHDNFHMYIEGRMQLDWYSYAGAGVPDTALKPTLFIRRLRPEITGEFLGHWRFMIAGDFGATAIDNPRGANEASAAPPRTAPTAANGKYAPAEAIRFQAAAADAFINYRAVLAFNVMVGQMDAPFTMENRTSDKFIPFIERSLAVRAVGVPTNKELGGMVWGETEHRHFYYAAGPYMGDGQNRPNVDSRFDYFGRVMVHPLATANLANDNPLKDLHFGGSFRWGSRDAKSVFYDYPAMTTQGAYAFWTPTYGASNGTVHVIPANTQLGAAGELRVPIGPIDVTGEVVYIKNDTREAIDGLQATSTERTGDIHGVSYYAMLGFWPFGKRDVNGVPGYGNPPRLDWSKSDPLVPDQALQLLAKWEQVALTYRSASRSGVADRANIDGDIRVNALSFGMNYWATKHVRVSLNYLLDMFPGSAPVGASTPGGPVQTGTNRAAAPGNTLAPGVNDHARDTAHSLNEVIARFAIAL